MGPRWTVSSLSDVSVSGPGGRALSPVLSLPSDHRSSHDALRGRAATGSDPGTDGVSGGLAPVLLGPLAGAETDGAGGTPSEEPSVLELEQGRSPVEEAGQEEEEGAEDEELGSAVEEGEEAAVALGALPAEAGPPWLQVRPAGPGEGGTGHPGGPGQTEVTVSGPSDV